MRLGVFCSSKPALAEVFRESTRDLIAHLEKSGVVSTFVYGGGSEGIMGLLREYASVPVVGHNLPRWNPLPEERVYPSLRERQAGLIDDSDGYLVLAGGVGTLYELFQVLCENDVEKKGKPVVVYDPQGVFEPLQELLDRMTTRGYITVQPKVCVTADQEEVSRFLQAK
jgi:uncharacterized protein (TIGR00730 family)